MPAPILTFAATITCPHGGRATIVPSNPTVQVAGSPVLVQTDMTTIVGCPFVIGTSPAPCLTIIWTAPAVTTKVNSIPVLLATSIGLCQGGTPGAPAIVVPAQLQVMGT